MITAEKKRQIQQYLKSLATANAIAVEQIQKTISLLAMALELDDFVIPAKKTTRDTIPDHETADKPSVEHATFSVAWCGQTCFLGNTLLFWFFDRLARTPNRYVPHIELLDDVWSGNRESTTIRGVAKRLRDRLSDNGMEKLAESIDGSVAGHYGLILV